MGETRVDGRATLVEASLILAAATAVIILVGFLREKSYYGRLGIDIRDLPFSVEHYMTTSFSILLYPVFFFLLYPAVESGYVFFKSKAGLSVEDADFLRPFHYISAPGAAAIIGLIAGTNAFAGIGDGSPNLIGDFTARDAGTWVGGLAIVAAILNAQLRGAESSWHTLLGKARSATFVLVAVTVSSLGLAGAADGSDVGSAAAWSCIDLPVITFDPPQDSLNPNTSYWQVVHMNDVYYVRDFEVNGNSSGFVMVASQNVRGASVEWKPGFREAQCG